MPKSRRKNYYNHYQNDYYARNYYSGTSYVNRADYYSQFRGRGYQYLYEDYATYDPPNHNQSYRGYNKYQPYPASQSKQSASAKKNKSKPQNNTIKQTEKKQDFANKSKFEEDIMTAPDQTNENMEEVNIPTKKTCCPCKCSEPATEAQLTERRELLQKTKETRPYKLCKENMDEQRWKKSVLKTPNIKEVSTRWKDEYYKRWVLNLAKQCTQWGSVDEDEEDGVDINQVDFTRDDVGININKELKLLNKDN